MILGNRALANNARAQIGQAEAARLAAIDGVRREVAEAQVKASEAALEQRDDRGGSSSSSSSSTSSSSSSRSDAPATGTLASDEALAALRDKLSGGQS